MKEENLKLKEMSRNADIVEKLKLENKIMKLELQKIKEDNNYTSRGSGVGFFHSQMSPPTVQHSLDMTQGST